MNIQKSNILSVSHPAARCFPRCHNGALCRHPNRCVCRRGFHGNRCEFSTVTFALPGQAWTSIQPTANPNRPSLRSGRVKTIHNPLRPASSGLKRPTKSLPKPTKSSLKRKIPIKREMKVTTILGPFVNATSSPTAMLLPTTPTRAAKMETTTSKSNVFDAKLQVSGINPSAFADKQQTKRPLSPTPAVSIHSETAPDWLTSTKTPYVNKNDTGNQDPGSPESVSLSVQVEIDEVLHSSQTKGTEEKGGDSKRLQTEQRFEMMEEVSAGSSVEKMETSAGPKHLDHKPNNPKPWTEDTKNTEEGEGIHGLPNIPRLDLNLGFSAKEASTVESDSGGRVEEGLTLGSKLRTEKRLALFKSSNLEPSSVTRTEEAFPPAFNSGSRTKGKETNPESEFRDEGNVPVEFNEGSRTEENNLVSSQSNSGPKVSSDGPKPASNSRTFTEVEDGQNLTSTSAIKVKDRYNPVSDSGPKVEPTRNLDSDLCSKFKDSLNLEATPKANLEEKKNLVYEMKEQKRLNGESNSGPEEEECRNKTVILKSGATGEEKGRRMNTEKEEKEVKSGRTKKQSLR